jgi:hypothetical protein
MRRRPWPFRKAKDDVALVNNDIALLANSYAGMHVDNYYKRMWVSFFGEKQDTTFTDVRFLRLARSPTTLENGVTVSAHFQRTVFSMRTSKYRGFATGKK